MELNSKLILRVKKILYPKDKRETDYGEFVIISCEMVELIEGDAPKLHKKWNNFTIKGSNIPPVFEGKRMEVSLDEEVEEEKYGAFYTIKEEYSVPKLDSEEDQQKFLLEILTPNQFDSLYSTLENPFEAIINKDTTKLCTVKGIKEGTVKKLYKKFERNFKYAPILVKYGSYGLTINIISKLESHYGSIDKVIKLLDEDIYTLAGEVTGIGFLTVDKYALKAGIDLSDRRRLKAFIPYTLYQEAQKGNSWVYVKDLLNLIDGNLGFEFSNDIIKDIFYELYETRVLDWDEQKTYICLRKYKQLERNIADEIIRLQNSQNYYVRNLSAESEIIKEIEENQGWEFTEEQKQAISNILDNQVSVLIGFAGSGKSSMIKAICSILNHYQVELCALSGKASQRLQEATAHRSQTIHRLLKYDPSIENSNFTFNKDHPLFSHMICLDETSMVGAELFYSLIQAIPNGSKVLLIGDTGQLESIGLANIFTDIINSEYVNVSKLTQIHRQAAKSGIVTNSFKIRNQEQICDRYFHGVKTFGELQDFTIDVYNDRILTAPKIMAWYSKFCKNLEDTKDTCVVLPTKYNGMACTYEINRRIQEEFNPSEEGKAEIKIRKNKREVILREGDKVINKVNNYSATIYDENPSNSDFTCFGEETEENEQVAEIFNGYMGHIVKVNPNSVVVDFDEYGTIIFFSEDISNLELAYAITCHSMQGAQVKNIIMGLDFSHYIMLCSNLLYTGITRAKKNCVVVAEAGALQLAIKTSHVDSKQTFLKEFLKSEKKA